MRQTPRQKLKDVEKEMEREGDENAIHGYTVEIPKNPKYRDARY